MSAPDPTARVRDAAAARDLAIEVRERPAAGSLNEAAALLGIPPAGIVKTLVVKRSDDTYLFALVPGDRSISWPKLRAIVGVNKLQLPDPARAGRDRLRAGDDRPDRQHTGLADLRR